MIYLITHKEIQKRLYNSESAEYIKVGAINSGDSGYLSDDFVGGISHKNSLYSELTGHYMLLKCCKDLVVGVCHYRRFFYESSMPGWFDRRIKYKDVENFSVNWNKLNEKLINKEVDVYLPKERLLLTRKGMQTIYTHFAYYKNSDYFDDFISELKQKDELMGKAYEKFVKSKFKSSYWNMLVCRKDDYVDLFSFLFEVLFSLEKKISEQYGSVEPRLMGYFTESFIPFWFHFKNKKIGWLNVAYVSDI